MMPNEAWVVMVNDSVVGLCRTENCARACLSATLRNYGGDPTKADLHASDGRLSMTVLGTNAMLYGRAMLVEVT